MSKHPIRTRINRTSRSLHRWAAILTLAPLGLVIATGIVLQLKKPVAWVQPPTMRGSGGPIAMTLPDILDAARAIPEMGVDGWEDVDRLDVRPDRGVVKVRGANRWEAQLDLATGETLHLAYRRSDLIEALHTGAFFSDAVAYWVFLSAGVLLLVMWATGAYLWLLPVVMRRRAHIRTARRLMERSSSRSRPSGPPRGG